MDERRPTADFVIEKPGAGIQLVVEAKNTPAPSREWAARFLRNLFVHAEIPDAPFFLLALRDHLYLWRRPSGQIGTPDYEGDTALALQPYLLRLHGSLEDLSERGFETLIYAWLNDVVAGAPEAAELLLVKRFRPLTLDSRWCHQNAGRCVIVYVETNFLLELAYLQERCESCDEILAFCQSARVSLVVPAFSIAEARRAWDDRLSERNSFQKQLAMLIRELARSEPFKMPTGNPCACRSRG